MPETEQDAMRSAVSKLEAVGDTLGYPHSSRVRGASSLRELRPRAGRSSCRVRWACESRWKWCRRARSPPTWSTTRRGRPRRFRRTDRGCWWRREGDGRIDVTGCKEVSPDTYRAYLDELEAEYLGVLSSAG